MDYLEPMLQDETIELREALPILTPYLSGPLPPPITGDSSTAAMIVRTDGRAATKTTGLHFSILCI